MRRLRMVVGYDGTDYAGWQRQQNGISVQQRLEETLDRLFHEGTRIQGSGRTDAGVHARGQVAAFNLAHPIPEEQLRLALNANLPEDIRVYRVEACAEDFHPQFDAKRKTYRYRFYQGAVMPPEYRRYAVLSSYAVDWNAVRAALPLLEGEHDFAACCASGSTVQSTVRTIYRAALLAEEEAPNLYTIEITGNGFLYNMVRILAGTLLEVGQGRISREMFRQALAEGNREAMGVTAPAKGLILWNVEYV